MSTDAGPDQPTVLCLGCGNPVEGRALCPTCGDNSRDSGAPLPADELDEALLNQVGIALAAEVDLAAHTAAHRMEAAGELVEESLVLRGRLRRQRALLCQRVAENREHARRLTEALGRVEDALHTARGRSTTHHDWSLRARLPRDRTCAMVARRLVEGHAGEDLAKRETESAMLIVSELATNALLHGAGVIILAVSRHGDRLRIEVSDEGHPATIGIMPPEARDVGGRGLFIVDQLAGGWGAPAGTAHVWAELALA